MKVIRFAGSHGIYSRLMMTGRDSEEIVPYTAIGAKKRPGTKVRARVV